MARRRVRHWPADRGTDRRPALRSRRCRARLQQAAGHPAVPELRRSRSPAVGWRRAAAAVAGWQDPMPPAALSQVSTMAQGHVPQPVVGRALPPGPSGARGPRLPPRVAPGRSPEAARCLPVARRWRALLPPSDFARRAARQAPADRATTIRQRHRLRARGPCPARPRHDSGAAANLRRARAEDRRWRQPAIVAPARAPALASVPAVRVGVALAPFEPGPVLAWDPAATAWRRPSASESGRARRHAAIPRSVPVATERHRGRQRVPHRPRPADRQRPDSPARSPAPRRISACRAESIRPRRWVTMCLVARPATLRPHRWPAPAAAATAAPRCAAGATCPAGRAVAAGVGRCLRRRAARSTCHRLVAPASWAGAAPPVPLVDRVGRSSRAAGADRPAESGSGSIVGRRKTPASDRTGAPAARAAADRCVSRLAACAAFRRACLCRSYPRCCGTKGKENLAHRLRHAKGAPVGKFQAGWSCKAAAPVPAGAEARYRVRIAVINSSTAPA